MSYLLDSDVLSSYLERDPPTIEILESLMLAGIAISIVTYMETYQVTLQGPDTAASQHRHAVALANVPILPLSIAVAQRCAQLRHDLSFQGRRVRSRALDLIIASTALEHDLNLVTRNRSDYQDIPDLRLA